MALVDPGAIAKIGVFTEDKTIRHRLKGYVDGEIHTGRFRVGFPSAVRGVMETWHRISTKHLAAHFDEMEFQFNNRSNPFLFRDTLMDLITALVLEHRKLIAA